jgi:hypothetical protein
MRCEVDKYVQSRRLSQKVKFMNQEPSYNIVAIYTKL